MHAAGRGPPYGSNGLLLVPLIVGELSLVWVNSTQRKHPCHQTNRQGTSHKETGRLRGPFLLLDGGVASIQ